LRGNLRTGQEGAREQPAREENRSARARVRKGKRTGQQGQENRSGRAREQVRKGATPPLQKTAGRCPLTDCSYSAVVLEFSSRLKNSGVRLSKSRLEFRSRVQVSRVEFKFRSRVQVSGVGLSSGVGSSSGVGLKFQSRVQVQE
jgi:hypothetical protein